MLPASLARADDSTIKTGDRLTIGVAGEADLSKVYIVDADGSIVVNLIGKVPVNDLTPAKLREELAQRLAKYVRSPQVTVDFAERAQISVGITGAVTKGGTVTLKKGSRLLDVLARAEGAIVEADLKKIQLTRRGEKTPRSIDLSALARDTAVNVELLDGDAVYVPRIQLHAIKVVGAVDKPGDLLEKEPITPLRAIESAGGLKPDADRRQVQILRRGSASPETYNLENALSGGGKTLLLADGDTITVPAIKKLGVKINGAVVKPGAAELREGSTVVDALNAAGGFAPDADRFRVKLFLPGGASRTLDLRKTDGPEASLALADGAVIDVSQNTRFFYVGGGVNKPDRYPLPAEGTEKVFLTQAIAMAGGPVERAKLKRVLVTRAGQNGDRPAIQEINLDKLAKNPASNVEILPGDSIQIPVEPERERKPKIWERLLGVAGLAFGL
jgi:protein involved in polysaccharide export with SLBB domain